MARSLIMVDVPPAETGLSLPAASGPHRPSARLVGLAVVLALMLIGGLGFLAVRVLDAPHQASQLDQQLRVTEAAPVLARAEPPSRGAADRAPLRVDDAWALSTGARAGIPTPAMRAYGSAVLVLDRTQPGCHLAWNTLAGIGWVESQHGTIGGRTLLADGRSSRPVVGPALDGSSFAAIRSTPSSRAQHGDETWEHAVGPLQFIASTWARWGADGDGDGHADPLDIDDAALAAADYLCADGHDLSTGAGWSAAVRSYNHDDAYVRNVLAAADTYASRTAS